MMDDQVLEWHLVAFLDVLGQREKLLQLRLPKTPEEYKSVGVILKDTVGIVETLRKSFTNQFDSFDAGFLKNRPELKKGASVPDFLPFSDAFVTSLTLRSQAGDDRITVVRLIAALSAAGFVMLVALANRYAVRGGIDVGPGVRLQTGEPYGRALVSAHVLESTVAEYPRIVIGDELWKYLSAGMSDTSHEALQRLMKTAAELTVLDNDGKRILDYMGKGLTELIPVDGKATDLVKRAYEGVIHQEEQCHSEGRGELSQRYSKTRRYFESRLAIWGLTAK